MSEPLCYCINCNWSGDTSDIHSEHTELYTFRCPKCGGGKIQFRTETKLIKE